MSQENYRHDSARWFRQAKADIAAARSSLKNGIYEWACFQAQQSAEKALKALWYHNLTEPWGHSVYKLIAALPKDNIKKSLTPLIDLARELDKLCIPTRYPNGLPELTPSEIFTKGEASRAIKSAQAIIDKAGSIINS